MKNLIIIALTGVFILSCKKEDSPPDTNPGDFTAGSGLFVINEGGFNQGNATVAYYDEIVDVYSENVFSNKNQRPLGDVANSMTIHNDKAYIIVNNSGTIEVVSMLDFRSIATIEGFSSPRNMLMVNDQKAYITDLSLPYIHIVDLATNSITGSVYTGKSTEAITMINNRVFVANWSEFFVPAPNNTVQVIDPTSDQLIDSITVTKEPNSLAIDKDGKLWVLCSGGYLGEEDPSLLKINPVSLDIEATYQFLNEMEYPVDLTINKAGDRLFWLNGGIYDMGIDETSLPQEALAEAISFGFNCLEINGSGNSIYAGDALDYQQKGIIYIFDMNGTLTGQFQAGIVPGFILFY